MAKRWLYSTHAPQGQRIHYRRRIAAWRKRGFSEDEIRTMSHALREIGPSYVGPTVPKAELEHARAQAHASTGSMSGGNHRNGKLPGAPDPTPPVNAKPDKHHSKYRAKHRR